MKVRITNLPADVAESDIRGLLDESEDIRNIELIEEGDADSPVAVVEMDGDAAAEAVVALINGRNWKNAVLRADKIIY